MKMVFADTVYWVAVSRPGDQWQQAAGEAKSRLGAVRLLTTDEVLTEFLTILGQGGPHLRRQAVDMVKQILNTTDVKVLPQTRDSFIRGLNFYGQRLDKQYSLTDCISMCGMRAESVSEILTIDRHFEQEGFNILMKRGTLG
jgi:predicted nucleic acid-binding protein